MFNPDIPTGCLIGMEGPSIPLVFPYCSTDILVVPDFYTFIFLQFTSLVENIYEV